MWLGHVLCGDAPAVGPASCKQMCRACRTAGGRPGLEDGWNSPVVSAAATNFGLRDACNCNTRSGLVQRVRAQRPVRLQRLCPWHRQMLERHSRMSAIAAQMELSLRKEGMHSSALHEVSSVLPYTTPVQLNFQHPFQLLLACSLLNRPPVTHSHNPQAMFGQVSFPRSPVHYCKRWGLIYVLETTRRHSLQPHNRLQFQTGRLEPSACQTFRLSSGSTTSRCLEAIPTCAKPPPAPTRHRHALYWVSHKPGSACDIIPIPVMRRACPLA